MNKKKKKIVEEKLSKDLLDKKDRKYIVEASIIKPSIYMAILLCILVGSLVYNERLTKFSKIMFNSSSLSIILVVFYFLILFAGIIIACVTITLSTFAFRKKDDNKLFKIGNGYDFFAFFVNVLSIIYFFLVFMFTPCTVSGNSMNVTLYDGDRVILWDWNSSYDDNDIVVFSGENYSLDCMLIKRVVASYGDVLSYNYSTGAFRVNGSYIETISVKEFNTIISGCEENSMMVPKGKLVVLGDNRNNSSDSRYFGMIESKDVYGKAFIRLYPFDKIEILK